MDKPGRLHLNFLNPLQYPKSVQQWRIERDEVVGVRKEAKKTGRIDDGISCQKKVLEFATNGYWASLYTWEKLPEIVVEPDRRLVGRVATVQGCLRVATEKEWRRLLEISENCEDEGFRHR